MVEARRPPSPPPLAVACIAIVGARAWPARAGETACWIDNGAVVVPAMFGDVSGDFILDLSAPHSQLHLTTAQSAGYTPDPEPPASVDAALTLAGERIPANLAVEDLDAREWGFPTTLNGLIGADVFAEYVVDLRLSPCRLTLRRRAPAAKALKRLPIELIAGVPTIAASLSDGRGRASASSRSTPARPASGSRRMTHGSAGCRPRPIRCRATGRRRGWRALSFGGLCCAIRPRRWRPTCRTALTGGDRDRDLGTLRPAPGSQAQDTGTD